MTTQAYEIIELDEPSALARYEAPTHWPALTAGEIVQHEPQRSIVVLQGSALCARCSLWWLDAPPFDDHAVGVIGHFGARDAQSAAMLLTAACDTLARQHCTIAIGPMDGSSWRRYRLVVERGTEPPFFLEPDNPDDWPAFFGAAGFVPVARYCSALNADLARRDPRADEVAGRLAANGVSVRQLDLARFDAELERIYHVATVSFRDALLYTPLPKQAFIAQYQAVKPLVKPELVLLAERDGAPVGFAFSVPDALEAARGEPSRTMIFKTLAILPDRTLYAGLGSLMAEHTHQAARALGFTRAIHALIHESNYSGAVSERTGRPMRRYALFGRRLT